MARRLRVAALACAIGIPSYFGITRRHDDVVTKRQFVCVGDASTASAYSRCGVYEKKLLYSEQVWGTNKLVNPLLRDDFGEFLWSLTAVLPFGALASFSLLRRS